VIKVEAVLLREKVEEVMDAVTDRTGHVGVTVPRRRGGDPRHVHAGRRAAPSSRTPIVIALVAVDVSEHGMWGYPELYIPVPGGYGSESHAAALTPGMRHHATTPALAES